LGVALDIGASLDDKAQVKASGVQALLRRKK
jgi:hypothetical protein